MALTYRSEKGEALTITELDDNFRYFTGSHSITGSLIVTQAITASSFSGSFTGAVSGTSSYASQALSSSFATTASYVLNTVSSSFATTASYVLNAVSSSYFSGSVGAATFTGDVNFTSGANVDGLFVVVPLTDTSITGGLQVWRGETPPGDIQFASLNYQGGGGRLVGVNKVSDTPSMFIMLQDSSANISMMEFRTVFGGGIGTAYITINQNALPTSEPSIAGQLWLSGSAGVDSQVLCVKK